MIDLEDRQALARDISDAHTAGARLELACEIAGISLRTLQRWQADEGQIREDGRPSAARPVPVILLDLTDFANCQVVWAMGGRSMAGAPREGFEPASI